MDIAQLFSIRLDLALVLAKSNSPEAKKTLKNLVATDPAIRTVLKQYGVEV